METVPRPRPLEATAPCSPAPLNLSGGVLLLWGDASVLKPSYSSGGRPPPPWSHFLFLIPVWYCVTGQATPLTSPIYGSWGTPAGVCPLKQGNVGHIICARNNLQGSGNTNPGWEGRSQGKEAKSLGKDVLLGTPSMKETFPGSVPLLFLAGLKSNHHHVTCRTINQPSKPTGPPGPLRF